MDGTYFDPELSTLLASLRRRRPRVSAEEMDAAISRFSTTISEAREADVVSHWLQALWHLSVYEERVAQDLLETARVKIGALLQVDGKSARLNELAAAINEGLVETIYMLNEYPQAHAIASTLWTQRMSTADRRSKALAATWLGKTQQQLGHYQEALRTLGRAVADFELAGCAAEASRPMNSLAVLQEELGDFKRAVSLYEDALARAVADNNADMEGRVLANWGDCLVSQKRYDDGLKILDRAISVLKPIDAHWHYAWCELAIGRIHAAKGDLETAAQFHLTALNSVRRCDAPRIEAEILAGAGELAARMGNEQVACEYLEAAIVIVERLQVEREIFRNHKLLSEVHKQFGNFEKALFHFEKFHEVRTKVFDQMARAKVAEIESEFEHERTKRDRELFQLRNVELASALEHVNHLNTELGEKARVLEELSTHDVLTGLYNRRYLYSRLGEEIQRFERYGTHFALTIYDIDNFKSVNDRFSHSIGDDVLRTLAQLIGDALRESDGHARFGGEEFAIILPGATREEAHVTMDKLREIVAGYSWEIIAPGLAVTISAGIAEVEKDESMTALLHRADTLMYQAKRGGRNQVASIFVPATE